MKISFRFRDYKVAARRRKRKVFLALDTRFMETPSRTGIAIAKDYDAIGRGSKIRSLGAKNIHWCVSYEIGEFRLDFITLHPTESEEGYCMRHEEQKKE